MQSLRCRLHAVGGQATGEAASTAASFLFCGGELTVGGAADAVQPALATARISSSSAKRVQIANLPDSLSPLKHVGSAGQLGGYRKVPTAKQRSHSIAVSTLQAHTLVRKPASQSMPEELCDGNWPAWFDILLMFVPSVHTRLGEMRTALDSRNMLDLQVSPPSTCC